MLTRLVRRQLAVFAVLGVAATVFTLLVYVDLPTRLGWGVIDIEADFEDTSGLYENALVTHHGAEVGRVLRLDVRGDGVTVVMRIDSTAEVPADVTATINSTSAIGEQYIDLVGGSSDKVISSGSTIARQDTREMPQIGPVLETLDRTLASVPAEATERVLSQVDAGLDGSADDLAALVEETTRFVGEAQQSLAATTGLIQNLSPVLETQQAVADSTTAYAQYLASFTASTDGVNTQIESLVETGASRLEPIDALVTDLSPTLPTMLANLTSTAQVLNVYLPNIEQTLVLYPPLISRIQSTLIPRESFDQVKLDLKANVNNPANCVDGYRLVEERRDPGDTTPRTVDDLLYCQQASQGPEGVRGIRNAPCPNDPARRSATPAGCGLVFPGATSSIGSDVFAATYDPATGAFEGPDGLPYVTQHVGPTSGRGSWTDLLTVPLAP